MTTVFAITFGISFTFLMTCLGAGTVFFVRKNFSTKFYMILMGFSAGIMVASSVFSLLVPAINLSKFAPLNGALVPTFGFLFGAFFLGLIDIFVSKLNRETSKNKQPMNLKLFIAITIHNIPEGLAVGFAFGSALMTGDSGAVFSVLGLAVGIGIQNFPEGAAVSLPCFAQVGRKQTAFFLGTLSGIVEPIFAVLGVCLSSKIAIIQPIILSFSAGAMMFVVADDLIPQSKKEPSFCGSLGFIFGFVLMMLLDICLS